MERKYFSGCNHPYLVFCLSLLIIFIMTNEKLGTKRKGQIYYHRNRGRYFKGNHEIHYVLPQKNLYIL